MEADLAHHWQALAPDYWRFYLRPAVRFHHGREMTVDDVIQSLSRMTGNPLFEPILSLRSPPPIRWTFGSPGATIGCPGCWRAYRR